MICKKVISTLAAVALLLAAGAFSAGVNPSAAASYWMKGELTAINLVHRTVVVEVPRGGEHFTVGGPLAGSAELQKNGHKAALKDFRTGETVKVKWAEGRDGHIILALHAI